MYWFSTPSYLQMLLRWWFTNTVSGSPVWSISVWHKGYAICSQEMILHSRSLTEFTVSILELQEQEHCLCASCLVRSSFLDHNMNCGLNAGVPLPCMSGCWSLCHWSALEVILPRSKCLLGQLLLLRSMYEKAFGCCSGNYTSFTYAEQVICESIIWWMFQDILSITASHI